jgi:hypothetical protein
MNSTVTVSLTPDLAGWLAELAQRSGKTEEEVAQQQLGEARKRFQERPWMALAGTIDGPPDLSVREGYGPR